MAVPPLMRMANRILAVTSEQAKQADAILLGAVGGPKWDSIERSIRPERGLLKIRSELNLFANLRPRHFVSAACRCL